MLLRFVIFAASIWTVCCSTEGQSSVPVDNNLNALSQDTIPFVARAHEVLIQNNEFGYQLKWSYYYQSVAGRAEFSGFKNPNHLLNALMVVPDQEVLQALFDDEKAPLFKPVAHRRQQDPETFGEKYFKLHGYFQPDRFCDPSTWVVIFETIYSGNKTNNYLVCKEKNGKFYLTNQKVDRDIVSKYSLRRNFVTMMYKSVENIKEEYLEVYNATRVDSQTNIYTSFNYPAFKQLCRSGQFVEICSEVFLDPVPLDITGYLVL